MMPIKEFVDGQYLTFFTKNGTVKKTDLMDYSRIRNGGLRAIELNDGDSLINVLLTDGEQTVLIGTKNGMAIRFDEGDVRAMGRTARGVRGVRLNDDDCVIGACIAPQEAQILVVTENGYGKKTPLSEYKIQSRGGKGIFTYKITDKTGTIAGLDTVEDADDIMLITSDGVLIRTRADEISTFGRQTQGVRIMKLANDVKLVSMAKTAREEDPDEEFESEADAYSETEE